MPILQLVLLDAAGSVVGRPNPRQWMQGVRLPDGRRSIEIDGETFLMESRRMTVPELVAQIESESRPDPS